MESFALLEEFVNLPELLGRIENDNDLLVELLTLFQEDLPKNREAFRIAVSAGDLRTIERAAHLLKGMLANLSVTQAASLAAEIESSARVGDTLKIRNSMAAFDLQITRFSSAVDACLAGEQK